MAETSSTPKTEAPKLTLDWEYCECGCKCYVAKAGPLYFSLLMRFTGEGADRKITDYELNNGHRGGQILIQNFKSFEDADRHAATLARPHVMRELERIKTDAKRLGIN